jgi:hypothetical protein
MTTYWAEIDHANIVQQVITGVDDATINGVTAQEWYTTFVGATCIQTFMNTASKNYAGVGYKYDAVNDNFIAPQPYPSWTLDSNDQWQPPTPQPLAPPQTIWDEQQQKWIAIGL